MPRRTTTPPPQEAARPPQGRKVATRPPSTPPSPLDVAQAVAVPVRQLWTSNFASAKHLPADITPVSIARWPPRNWRGARCIELAPAADALKRYRAGAMNDAEYTRQYRARLASLDAAAILAQLPPQAALLCFCDAEDFCHRHLAADWLKRELGIAVPEHGTRPKASPQASDQAYRPLPYTGTPLGPDYSEFDCDHCTSRKGKHIEILWGAPRGLCPACGQWSDIEWDPEE
jgi:hypothetical protein